MNPTDEKTTVAPSVNQRRFQSNNPIPTSTTSSPRSRLRWCVLLLLPLAFLAVLAIKDDVFSFGTMFLSRQSPSIEASTNSKEEKSGTSESKHDPNVSLSEQTPVDQMREDFGCVWKPNDDIPCVNRVSKQLQSSLDIIPAHHHRWVFMGDSTMWRLYRYSGLSSYTQDSGRMQRMCPHYHCQSITSDRCDMNEILNLPRSSHWKPPNLTLGEGPRAFGLENPFCQDCQGCTSSFLWCRKNGAPETPCAYNDTNQVLVHGGYFSVEFARDVEVQTEHCSTTQECLAYYLERDWNTVDITEDFGRPICVVGTGHHDVGVANITQEIFLTNVDRYITLLSAQCDHIIWLSNNCPQSDDYFQKANQTREWNMGMRDILMRRSHASFVDVFEASRIHLHDDNIHMNSDWYRMLGGMIRQIVQGSSS